MRKAGEQVLALPKVLLHDHLDGGLRPSTVAELAAETGYDGLPTTDPTELAEWFRASADSGSLVRYLETFEQTVGVMQTESALHRVASECAQDLAADGVVYAEVRYAPEQHLERGLTLEQVVEAVNAGFRDGEARAAEAGHRIRVVALLTAMRHAAKSTEIAELAVRYRDDGVGGFDIAGAEAGYPPTRHLDAFEYLRRENAHFTIHAGEAFGLPSIWEAIQWCGADRLGHGVRIVDDMSFLSGSSSGGSRKLAPSASSPDDMLFVPGSSSGGARGLAPSASSPGADAGYLPLSEVDDLGQVSADHVRLGRLASYVRDCRIPLEMCPSSNVQTGAARSIEAHPITLLKQLRFRVTVNTDNRLMSDTSMSSEMQLLVDEAGWTPADLLWVTVNAMKSAFLPFDERLALINEVIKPGYAALVEAT